MQEIEITDIPYFKSKLDTGRKKEGQKKE